ncbi:DNA polymerase III subunit delta' C-terminal domain-containing protein [Legionella brunensis]|uniref:DNA polymerase III subunit delta' n=1 Tax=Legionella brunensis TaxID=29422 RepID=A0A0W0S4D8_9GAMM|nr:DNA polymerase III subunit delta' C-terminal domain-containing protein [Legionella brunensis]KTC78218.1 DNA polymerase III, delta' subunit [Legionella brunensis]
MQSLKSFDESKSAHAVWWEQFRTISDKQRLPQALLLIGPEHADILDFTYEMAATLLCSHEIKPCGECKSCRLLNSKEHPDLYLLQPEKSGSTIKIDQIRELQTVAFTSPQLGDLRLIIIRPAEKMNVAAANALLKLLEEPPACINFILIAEQISTMLPTILSRCQQWRLANADIVNVDYLTIGEGYAAESERGKIFAQHNTILQELLDLRNQKISICELAAKWNTYELSNLIWLIYLINSQMLHYQLISCSNDKKNWTQQLHQLSQCFQPPQLFHQLDELNNIMRKLNQNSNVNSLLILENLLLGYCITA